MDTKYIFLDIDGTLVGRDAVIPESARQAILKARENGHKVFICSGRSRAEMHEDILSVEMDGIIGSAGAYVEVGGKMIYHRPMTEKMNARLLDYFGARGIAILLETNEDLYVNEAAMNDIREYTEYCKLRNEPYDEALFGMAKPLSEAAEPAKLPVNKLLYVTKKFKPEDIRRDLEREFTVVDSAITLPGNSGEISEYGMHKGKGIRIVTEYFGADLQDTIGIGDGENDIGMLKSAGTAIAMGNANPLLKEIADYVTTDVDADGIKNAFYQYGLI
ncbi:MAG: HAD family hydrolase [Bacteroidales bacterium]|nr:HAD family hydrolase [Clostridium sp.]MCM1204807.1 HAD family hydrolase [Bacteroidales bacterium]